MQRSLVGSEMCIRDRKGAVEPWSGFPFEKRSISRVLAPPGPRPTPPFLVFWNRFSREKTRYLSSSGAPRAAPNPSIPRVLERFSREKTRYFSSSGAPRAPPEKGAGEPGAHQPPAGLTIYHKYTSILTKRKHKPQTAHTRSDLARLAGPRGRRTSPACGSFRRPLLKSCLLYTSPSPRDYAASRMPSSA